MTTPSAASVVVLVLLFVWKSTLALKVAIVGGGLSGLSTGIALRNINCETTVFERAPALSGDAGTGLTLWPNGQAALGAIDRPEGLAAELEKLGCATEFLEVTDASGSIALPNPTGDPREFPARYGHAMRNVRWSTLQAALYKRYTALGGRVVYDRRATFVDPATGSVSFVDRDGVSPENDDFKLDGAAYDVVVGADGLRSAFRDALVGDGAPRDAGRAIWRAVVPFDDALKKTLRPHSCSMSAGAGKVGFVVDIGDGLVYWSAFSTDEAREYDRADFDDVVQFLRAEFKSVTKLQAFFDATPPDAVLERRVADRAPLVDSVSGEPDIPWAKTAPETKCTLVGDAFHAMIPSLGQGANSAFEGAYRLARALNSFSWYSTTKKADLVDALRAYERDQTRRVAWIVEASARQGRTVYEDRDEFMRAQQAAQDSMWGITFDSLLDVVD